ncbi:hypothetical protein [Streptomyces sp. MBT27]|uniref:hypothetical protein n=1 Tax=Streptomyces sp. MBT27 TaxID=1488356 RepID=UPI001F07C755|nr:hypothetical protein [Streptomyces sp. MBT27]
MPHCIARLIEPLLRLLLPAQGRHRPIASPSRITSSSAHHQTHPSRRLATHGLRRGEDSLLVRPYLLAHEAAEEHLRRQRRRSCGSPRTG